MSSNATDVLNRNLPNGDLKLRRDVEDRVRAVSLELTSAASEDDFERILNKLTTEEILVIPKLGCFWDQFSARPDRVELFTKIAKKIVSNRYRFDPAPLESLPKPNLTYDQCCKIKEEYARKGRYTVIGAATALAIKALEKTLCETQKIKGAKIIGALIAGGAVLGWLFGSWRNKSTAKTSTVIVPSPPLLRPEPLLHHEEPHTLRPNNTPPNPNPNPSLPALAQVQPNAMVLTTVLRFSSPSASPAPPMPTAPSIALCPPRPPRPC